MGKRSAAERRVAAGDADEKDETTRRSTLAQELAALDSAKTESARLAAMHSARRALAAQPSAALVAPPQKKKKKKQQQQEQPPVDAKSLQRFSARVAGWVAEGRCTAKLEVAVFRSVVWLASRGENFSKEQRDSAVATVVAGMCSANALSAEALEVVSAEAAKHDDFRLLALKAAKRGGCSVVEVLMRLNVPEKSLAGANLLPTSDSGTMDEQKKAASSAWLAALKAPIDEVLLLERVLEHVALRVLPRMPHPLPLADFFVSGFKSTKYSTRALALSGIFELVARHRLEYKDLYPQLLTLVTPELLSLSPERSKQVFRLLTACLRSEHVETPLLRAFALKLAALAARATPRGIVQSLALVRDLLLRSAEVKTIVDDGEQDDPPYELDALAGHYSPNVRALVADLRNATKLSARDAAIANLENATPDSAYSYAALYAAAPKTLRDVVVENDEEHEGDELENNDDEDEEEHNTVSRRFRNALFDDCEGPEPGDDSIVPPLSQIFQIA